MIRRAAGLLALAGALFAGPHAQAQERGGTPGEFDFYVLALSWSPGYCETTGDRRGSDQCRPERRLGFVVHGLWPQYTRGYPSFCGTGREAPRTAIEDADDIYPDRGLARHEWRSHGTCSGLSPTAYFAAVRRARDRVSIPDPMVGMQQGGQTTAASLERAFVAVNDGLRPDMMAVSCRRGALQEVRICMDRDLRGFRTCPEVDRAASCRFGPIRVEAPR